MPCSGSCDALRRLTKRVSRLEGERRKIGFETEAKGRALPQHDEDAEEVEVVEVRRCR